jgi:hypothetical protein
MSVRLQDSDDGQSCQQEPAISLCQTCLMPEHEGECRYEDVIYAIRIKRNNPCEGCMGDCVECEELKK